jgi:O-acetyl-ADP-ribose deacetylase (regulator of RNase III)
MKKQSTPTFTLHGEVTEERVHAMLSALARVLGAKNGVDIEIVRKAEPKGKRSDEE